MIRYRSQKQLTLTGFKTPFETELDTNNRWVKLSDCIPWDELAHQAHHINGVSNQQSSNQWGQSN